MIVVAGNKALDMARGNGRDTERIHTQYIDRALDIKGLEVEVDELMRGEHLQGWDLPDHATRQAS